MGTFNLSDWALEHRSLVWYFMIAFMAAGLFAYLQLGRQEDPDFTIKTMVIGAQWPGASPEEMARQVTDRIEKKLEELAKYAHKKFVSAFKSAKHPRYTVVDAPSKDAMTLDLHLLEWEPNAFTGFIARETIDLLTFPAVGDLIWKPVRASTTIEGRLIEPKSRKPVYEFADKEEAKTIIVIPVQEAYPTGQARFAIREWAKQLQLVLHKEPHKKPVDSSPIQIWGF